MAGIIRFFLLSFFYEGLITILNYNLPFLSGIILLFLNVLIRRDIHNGGVLRKFFQRKQDCYESWPAPFGQSFNP
jgi:hypothetical protein